MTDLLSERDFARLAELIHKHSGIQVLASKRLMLESRLRRRVRLLGLQDIDDYCRYIFDHGHLEAELTAIIDLATINKTDFFREPDHFDFLRTEAIPQLLAHGRAGRLLKLWSAAAANGAEAYTIAMVMADMGLQAQGTRFAVLGTDICTEVLEQAATGIYPAVMADAIPPDVRHRYVMRSRDRQQTDVRIVPELRRLVQFQWLNLMSPSYPVDRDVDVIFLRNVLIYFDRPTQLTVLRRLSGHLRTGGYLLLGHSESMAGSDLELTQIAPTVYRRM